MRIISSSVFQFYRLILTNLNMNSDVYNRIHKISMT